MRWLRFSIKTMFVVTFVAADFLAGFCVGVRVNDGETWQDVGGVGSISGFPVSISCTAEDIVGCKLAAVVSDDGSSDGVDGSLR
jgi:hypothetical protein